MTNIQMVDLKGQYTRIKNEIDNAIQSVLDATNFINGSQVSTFQKNLESYLNVKHVIPCANGTDALQLAFMALDLQPGDEVIIPAFTYVATAEVIALLKLIPVMVDVDLDNFNINIDQVKANITSKTKAIVPVHLFGQAANMEDIMDLANKHNLYVVEDNAQALGADYVFSNGTSTKLGTIGHVGSTSFFPSKNLGCYGDGGALMTNDDDLAQKIKMMANHGQKQKYYHETIGCNSRLDTLQAAILDVKLKYLDDYRDERNKVADYYDAALANISQIELPSRNKYSNHVFHQYTMKLKNPEHRDKLKQFLYEQGIPTMVYYPLPLYDQKAYKTYVPDDFRLQNTDTLVSSVLSLPIHTEMDASQKEYIVSKVKEYFNTQA
jgi:UDP-2-acetamido-2-deoxy-ribo-hexuluronate aminotransferase